MGHCCCYMLPRQDGGTSNIQSTGGYNRPGLSPSTLICLQACPVRGHPRGGPRDGDGSAPRAHPHVHRHRHRLEAIRSPADTQAHRQRRPRQDNQGRTDADGPPLHDVHIMRGHLNMTSALMDYPHRYLYGRGGQRIAQWC